MSKKMLLMTSLIVVSLMGIYETLWLGKSSWALLILGILLLAALSLIYLLCKETGFRIKPLDAILIVCALMIVIIAVNAFLPNHVKYTLGVPRPTSPNFPPLPKVHFPWLK